MFTVADAGDLAFWFHDTSVWGCSAHDSDFGNNWHVQVGASLSFKTGRVSEALGSPCSGAQRVVAHDPAPRVGLALRRELSFRARVTGKVG